MIKTIRSKLRAQLFYSGISASSYTAKILQSLYPDLHKSFSELITEFNVNIQSTLSHLKSRGLITYFDKKYCLTDHGVWFAISIQLGVTFIELCLLACACCVQERYDLKKINGIYPTPEFEAIFDSYYSKKRLVNICSEIRSKGFGYKISNQTLKIYSKKHEQLMSKYGVYFRKLEAWVNDLPEKEYEITMSALGA